MSVLVEIKAGPLSPAGAYAQLAALGNFGVGCGAVVRFEGVVRPSEAGKEIRGLNYEAYEVMALKELRKLGEAVVERFRIADLAVWHSTGFVGNGECSFVLVIASKHRKEALAGMDYFIDAMKRDVPLWKGAVGQ